MKKFYLYATLALAMCATNVLAQSNDYKMVIETTNGTTITLGQNDVKSISFNDGQLVVSGAEAGSVMKKIAETEGDYYTKAEIDLMFQAVYNLLESLPAIDPSSYVTYNQMREVVEQNVWRLEGDMNVLKDSVYYLRNVVYQFADDVLKLDSRVSVLEALHDGDPTLIQQLEIGGVERDGYVSMDGLVPGSNVELFTVGGELVRRASALSDGTASVDVQGLAPGVYVARSGNKSVKFIKK